MLRPYCRSCHERRQAMSLTFCWWPTPVYSMHFPELRSGFRWFDYVWRDSDGRHYVEEGA